MTDTDRYFQLKDHVGVTADGNLEPLHEIGLAMNVPVMRDGEAVEVAQRVQITTTPGLTGDQHARILPGSRIVQVRDPRIAQVLLQSGQYEEVDPPTKREAARQKSETQDAREEAGTHEEA